MTHTIKNSSGVIHLRDTKYILIHSFNKYLLDTEHVLYSVLGIIPDFRDIEKKKYTAV